MEFNELLNDLEPHIFNFITDNLSELPNDLSKEEQIEFITSNYTQEEIEDLIEEYNMFEIEMTETLNSLEDNILEMIAKGLKIPDFDKDKEINYIITNFPKDQIEYAIYDAELKYELQAELYDLEYEEFELIANHFDLSKELHDKESIIDYMIENYTVSQINTAIEIADKKMVFYNEMLDFDDEVFSFICFNYASLDYNSFKSLENQDSRKDKAYYLISNYSPYELNQKAAYFANKIDLFNALDQMDEVYFRILIKNMEAYSFFLTRPDIIYNLMINYSDYIIYIEMDRARSSFKVYDELRNLDDKRLLFLANYLNAPEEMIDNWIKVSDFDSNIFKDYDVNPKNHIISFNIKDEEKEEETQFERNKLFKFNNYFEINPLELSPKEEIAYFIFTNKSIEDIVEGLNSFPNLIVDSEGNVIEDTRGDNISEKENDSNLESEDVELEEDSVSVDEMDDEVIDNEFSESIDEIDDEVIDDTVSESVDEMDDEVIDDDGDDDSKGDLDDSDNEESKDNLDDSDNEESKDDLDDSDNEDSNTIKVKIVDEDKDNSDEIKVKIIDSDDKTDEKTDDSNKDLNELNEEADTATEDSNEEEPDQEVSEEEYTSMLNNLESAVLKILIKKLGIVGNNKVAIIDYIISNYSYEDVEDLIKYITFKLDQYEVLESLDDVTFNLFLKRFSNVPKELGRFEKIDYIISHYAPAYIESNLKMVQKEINEIRLLLEDEDLFFDIATYFDLPLHATKEEQIDYLLSKYTLARIRNRISFYDSKQRVENFIFSIVDKNMMRCPTCGSRLRRTDKYCVNCGTKISVNVKID